MVTGVVFSSPLLPFFCDAFREKGFGRPASLSLADFQFIVEFLLTLETNRFPLLGTKW